MALELAFGARLPGNTPQRHKADPPGIGINQRNITTTTWHLPEPAAHGPPGATPPTRKSADWIPELQAPDVCVTQKPGRLPGPTTLPGRSPGVTALPQSKFGTSQPTQTQRAPSPGFGQARDLTELTAQLRADTKTLSPQILKPTNWITNGSAQISTSQTDSKRSPALAAPLLTKSGCQPANPGPDSTKYLHVL